MDENTLCNLMDSPVQGRVAKTSIERRTDSTSLYRYFTLYRSCGFDIDDDRRDWQNANSNIWRHHNNRISENDY